jgi:hypothetical protein
VETRTLALLSAAVALLGAGCAARRAPAASAAAPADARCQAAFGHADGVLRAGLEQVMTDLTRYVKVRDPGADTAAAAARTRARADAFTAARGPAYVEACRAYPEDRLRCVERAAEPRDLSACGEEALVTAFTDEVLAEFTSDPLARTPVPTKGPGAPTP